MTNKNWSKSSDPKEEIPESTPINQNNEVKKVKVISSGLHVRREPNKVYDPIYRLSKGDVIEATSYDDGVWISILAEGDRVGYVMKEFTEPLTE